MSAPSQPPCYQGLAPIIGESPRLLLLGTFPSPLSRQSEQYYGNPRNSFWRIIFALADKEFQEPSYPEKTALLCALGLALWDVIASCRVEGAADSAIHDAIYNTDIPQLFDTYPSLRGIAFNGGNALRFYRKGIGPLEEEIVLPSTSPANARYRYEEKLQRWREALGPYLRINDELP